MNQPNVTGETIRERAENHFAVSGWSVNTDIFASRERKAVPVPGGNETFAAMTPAGDTGLAAIYPEIGDLGALDYSGIDIALVDVMDKVASQAKDRKLDASLCDSRRNFLSTVVTYRLVKLPDILSAWYSRPEVGEPDQNSRLKAKSDLRLLCKTKNGPVPLRVTVTLSGYSGSWSVEDVSFDGKGYAALAQQN